MNLLLKSGAIVFLGGGGATVIPFIKFSSSAGNASAKVTVTHSSGGDQSRLSYDFSGGSQEPRKVELPTQPAKNIDEERENCSFNPDEDKTFIEPTSSSFNYFAFSCDNRGRHEEVIKTTWTIWLPETLLNNSKDSFHKGMRVNIKTQSADMTGVLNSLDYYRTKFESSIFSANSITGTWGDNIVWNDSYVSSGEEQIYTFKITDPKLEKQEIYLKMKQ